MLYTMVRVYAQPYSSKDALSPAGGATTLRGKSSDVNSWSGQTDA